MDFRNYLTDSTRTGSIWWAYEFPNGHSASVIPDLHQPFHFEVESSDPDDLGRGRILIGLTTGGVEAKLAKLAALPQNEDAE